MKEVINMNISVKNKKRIGQDIIELRLALGENQKQFATRFNVSQNAVSLWEKGEIRPRRDKLLEIKHLYDQTFLENKKSNVPSFDKGQTSTNPDVLDKLTDLVEILISERLGTNNSIEQYSTEELFMELERRILKKTTYKSRHS